MNKHKNIFTIHKTINHSKYNRVKRTVFPPDIKQQYEQKRDGWCKKRQN